MTSDLVLYFIISAVQYLPFVFAPVFYTYLRNIWNKIKKCFFLDHIVKIRFAAVNTYLRAIHLLGNVIDANVS